MASGMVTGGLGALFWVVAARGFAPESVGRASAIISAATLLAAIAGLGLGPLYERFLGLSGMRTVRYIRDGILVTAAVALIAGCVFLLLGPTAELFPDGSGRWVFPVCVAVLALFALLDPILIGLKRASWVAVKNITQSGLKLLVLVVVASVWSTAAGIVAAWVVPAAVVALVAARKVAAYVAGVAPGERPLPSARRMWAYFGNSYAISVLGMMVPLIVPLMVVDRLGTAANAYFAMCWMMVVTVELLIAAPAGPFVAACATAVDHVGRWQLATQMIRMCTAIGVATGVVLFVAAPWILGIFGASYAEEGTGLLRLMALTLPLLSLMTVYGSLARAEGRLRLATLAQCVNAACILAGVLPALGSRGLEGIGYTFLIADLITVVIVLPAGVRILGRFRRARPHSGDFDDLVEGRNRC